MKTKGTASRVQGPLPSRKSVRRTLDDEFLFAKASGKSDDEGANAALPGFQPSGAHAQSSDQADERQEEKKRQLALKLETHDAFIDLLRHALQNSGAWPENEKTEDQRKKDFVPDLEPQSDEEEEEEEEVEDEESDDDDGDDDEDGQAERDTDDEREPEDNTEDYDLLIEFGHNEDDGHSGGETDAQEAGDHADDSDSPARPNPALPAGGTHNAMQADESAPSSSVRRSERVFLKRKADEAKATRSKRSRQD